jgi:hypothetical protein
MRSFIFYTHTQIILAISYEGEWGGWDMWHAWKRNENVQGFGGKARRKEATWKTKA